MTNKGNRVSSQHLEKTVETQPRLRRVVDKPQRRKLVMMNEFTPNDINQFRSLFKGSEDVFSIRWEKSGYMPAYQYGFLPKTFN